MPGFITCNSPRGDDREHITEKPLELMRSLVRIAPPGGLVVDPFAGSGTTGAACLAEGRRFIGFEIDPVYVEIARRRIAGPLFAGASAEPVPAPPAREFAERVLMPGVTERTYRP